MVETAFIFNAAASALAPRRAMLPSDWADANRIVKISPMAGPWQTNRTPFLREPMDCFSSRSAVREIVMRFPIQSGKSEVQANALGFLMTETPGVIMVALPGEVSINKWINQKLNPLLESSPIVRAVLASTASRDSTNQRFFKAFDGGQLYMEHAGNPARAKSTTAQFLFVDELDAFAANFPAGDDPVDMLDGRTSAFPVTYKRCYVSTPDTEGSSRIQHKFLQTDQRHYHVQCPHCDALAPLEWRGLAWSLDPTTKRVSQAWYVCQTCGVEIGEHHKSQLLRDAKAGGAARWVPHNTSAPKALRGYTLNCLYYPLGLGPRWADLAQMWVNAQADPSRLKTFTNDRLAQPFKDPSFANVREATLLDKSSDYPLRHAPAGVLAVTAGVDTQDNRLEVQLVGWGRNLRFWVLDYVVLYGDPALPDIWDALVDLINQPITHASGALLRPLAVAQDMLGHKTEEVKAFSRRRRIARHMPVFGAKNNSAPILGKPRPQDTTFSGRVDFGGLLAFEMGTVAIKRWLFERLAADASADTLADPAKQFCHFSNQLPPEYFGGLLAEVYNPKANRFERKRGAPRNEPLDTWVQAFAAVHHPELRLHRRSAAEWDAVEQSLLSSAGPATDTSDLPDSPQSVSAPPQTPRQKVAKSNYLAR